MIVKPGLTLADLGVIDVGGYTDVPRNTVWGTVENSLRLGGAQANKYLRKDATGTVQSIQDTIRFDNVVAIELQGDIKVLPVINSNDEEVYGIYNIGAPNKELGTVYATTFDGVATKAQYADLAERFEADQQYEPGTVVALGGDKEITAVTEDLSDDVFGVVSTAPAYLMNSSAGQDATHPAIASVGRVPVKVQGPVNKNDRLVSAGNGVARAATKDEITPFNVIGRALAQKTTNEVGLVEAIVRISL
jgi:hypothetical protein